MYGFVLLVRTQTVCECVRTIITTQNDIKKKKKKNSQSNIWHMIHVGGSVE